MTTIILVIALIINLATVIPTIVDDIKDALRRRPSAWVREYENATPERRYEMRMELLEKN